MQNVHVGSYDQRRGGLTLTDDDRLTAFLGAWLGYRAMHVDVPGFSVAVARRGRLLFSQAYGLADIASQEPLTPEHLFGVGSISKLFTATCALLLVADNRLELDAPACRYVPWLSQHSDPAFARITIHQLLSHSTGLQHDMPQADFWLHEHRFPDRQQVRAAVLAAQITPDVTLKYSNLGFALLGLALEAASGIAFSDLVQKMVVEAMGLRSTVSDYAPRVDRYVTGYGVAYEGGRAAFTAKRPRRAYASVAGAFATAADVCQFMANYCSGASIVPAHLRAAATSVQSEVRHGLHAGTQYGLGFKLETMAGQRVIGHTGHISGCTSAVFGDPQAGLIVAVLANAKDVPCAQIVQGIFEASSYFTTTVTPPVSGGERFATIARSPFTALQIVASDRLAATSPDSWRPFAQKEVLTRTDKPGALKVTTSGSMNGYGETMTFSFAKDAVQALTYAGVTFLPKPPLRRPAKRTLTYEQLQHLDIRIGRVVRVERLAPPAGPARVAIDFGLRFGIKTSIISYLPPATNDIFKGALVLGALFPRWSLAGMQDEVLPLGIAPERTGYHTFMPGDLFYLEPDPCFPRTFTQWSQMERINHQYVREIEGDLFRLELMPEYDLDEIGLGTNSSARAWMQGKINQSYARMAAERRKQYWARPLVHNKNVRKTRIRIIDENLTTFQRYEINYFQRFTMPLIGEQVFLLKRKFLSDLELPPGDLTLFGNTRGRVNGYNGSRLSTATFYDSSAGHDMAALKKLRQQLIQLALRHGQLVPRY